MDTMLIFTDAPKKATNLTLNSKALEMAKDLGINVSQTLDTFLQSEVRRQYQKRWREDNKEAIAAYNERVIRDGCFGDNLRDF